MNQIVFSRGPAEGYTRHSEGAFLRLKDDSIFFVYSRFTGNYHDDAPSDLAATISRDEGQTWSEPATLIPASLFNVENIMSVSLMRMANDDVGLFYIVKRSAGVSDVVLSRSSDEGKTFYATTVCTLPDRQGYYVLNNDRVERLKSGRLVMPLAYHRGSYEQGGKIGWLDGKGFLCFLLSDDDGRTWFEAPDCVYPPFTGSRSGLQEPGVIEKENGVLWAYARTDRAYQYESYSLDGGMHWTGAQPSRFTSPESPLKIKRRPETGDLYAVWNPIPKYNGREISRAGWGRIPLVWAVSKDDGVTWSEQKIIESEEGHGYCYPAIFFTRDNSMLVAYCAGGADDGICLARLTIKKIDL